MKIDWSEAGLSNHQCVALATLADALGHTGEFDPVLPADLGARPISISRRGAPTGFDGLAHPHHRLIKDTYAAIDYATQRVFRVQYQSRSASNYKLSGEAFLEGRLTPETHALILTVLGGSEDGCFIPSQLGLEDVQSSGGWDLDFDDEDHVWHEFEGIYPAKVASNALPLADVLVACRNTLSTGWDDIGAISRLAE